MSQCYLPSTNLKDIVTLVLKHVMRHEQVDRRSFTSDPQQRIFFGHSPSLDKETSVGAK